MTTSHMQLLTTTSAHKNIGPVKPIGQLLPVYAEQLNNSSNNFNNNNNLNITMGVSNTRIIHRNLINTPINGHSTRLSPQSIQERLENRILTARRSLFGSPEPGEIKNLYNENVQRERDRFVKRYGFDIFTEKFVNDNNITLSDNNTSSRILEGQDKSSNTNCNNNSNYNSNIKNLDNNLLNEDRLHEQNNDEINSKLNNSKNLNENPNCNKLVINHNNNDNYNDNSNNNNNKHDKCDEYNHINNNNSNNNNNNNEECNNINNEIINSNSQQQSISTTLISTTTPLKDKKSSLISFERSKPYTLPKQTRISEYYSSRKTISTSDTPKPQKAKLLDENIINELQQNNHEKCESSQKV